MITDLQLRVDPATAYNPLRLQATISTQLSVDANRISDVVIAKRSIDARQRRVMVNLSVKVYIDEKAPEHPLFVPIEYRELPSDAPQAVII